MIFDKFASSKVGLPLDLSVTTLFAVTKLFRIHVHSFD